MASLDSKVPTGVSALSIELLDLILSNATDRDLRRVQTVSRLWHDVALRLSLRLVSFTSTSTSSSSSSSARRFLSSHRTRFSPLTGTVSSLAPRSGAEASVRGYVVDAQGVGALGELVAIAPALQSLTLQSDAHLPVEVVSSIWASRPSLRHLRLRCHLVPGPKDKHHSASSPSAVGAFLASCVDSAVEHPHFETLEIGARSDVSDDTLIPFLARFGWSLKTIELNDCHRLSANAIRALGEFCPRLADLTIRRAEGILLSPPANDDLDSPPQDDSSPFEALARGCPRLRGLTLAELPTPLPPTPALSSLAHLDSLSLTLVSLSSSFLLHLTSLRHLSLASCKITGPLPVEAWKDLEGLSVLGSTLCVGQMRRLIKSAKGLRKVSVDGIGPVLALFPVRPRLMTAPTDDFRRPCLTDLLDEEEDKTIAPWTDHNLLSSSVPSDVIIALFSLAPSLQSLALFGCQDDGPIVRFKAATDVGGTSWLKSVFGVAAQVARAVLLLQPPVPATPPHQLMGWGKGIAPGGARLTPDDVEVLKLASGSLINVWV